MALTLVNLATIKTSENETRIVDITFDSSYPNTGGTVGEPVAASDLGLDHILGAIIGGTTVATKRVTWNQATKCLRIYTEDGTTGIAAEAANASDQSAVTVTCMFVGK